MRHFLLGVCVLSLAVLGQSQAVAGFVYNADQLLSDPSGITFKLTNYEAQNVDANGNLQLDVGDSIRGIFTVTSSTPQAGGAQRNLVDFELTGIFETEILSVTANSGGAAGTSSFSDFVFGAVAGGVNGTGAGSMIAFYEDFTPDFSSIFGAGSIAAAEAFATDGTLYATFGAPTGNQVGAPSGASDYYWVSSGYANLLEAALIGSITDYSASLALLSQPGTNLVFTKDQIQAPTTAFGGLGLETILNHLAFKGSVEGDNTNSPYPLQSQDPGKLRAVPEPTSLAAFGLLVVVGVVGRRRRTKK